jgi:hypothetical protein
MKYIQQKQLEMLCVAALIGCVHNAAAEPVQPAGDDLTFVAPFVDTADGAFEHPDVANGPWNTLRPKKVILLPQNLTTPSRFEPVANDIDVRIVHNGAWIGVAVTWRDDEKNEMTATGVFSDALAIGFPKKDLTATSPFMGGHDSGMEINYWRALWQRDVDVGFQEVVDLHPNTVADEYVGFRSESLPESNPASSAKMAEVMATPEGREGLPAVAIGNPMSQVDRKTPVEQSIAEGFGTLTTQKQQDARANAVHKDGHWTVVITRPLDTGDAADALLSVGKESAINFAVWNGGEGDVSGRKSYTMFTPLLIAEKE